MRNFKKIESFNDQLQVKIKLKTLNLQNLSKIQKLKKLMILKK